MSSAPPSSQEVSEFVDENRTAKQYHYDERDPEVREQ